MSDTWSASIAGAPPSINDTYRVIYHGPRCPTCGRGQPRLGKKAGVEAWQESVAWHVRAARPSGWKPGRRVRIVIDWRMPREGRDADGPTKALLDGVKVGLGIDDRYFLHTIRSNEVDRAAPRTMLEISNEP